MKWSWPRALSISSHLRKEHAFSELNISMAGNQHRQREGSCSHFSSGEIVTWVVIKPKCLVASCKRCHREVFSMLNTHPSLSAVRSSPTCGHQLTGQYIPRKDECVYHNAKAPTVATPTYMPITYNYKVRNYVNKSSTLQESLTSYLTTQDLIKTRKSGTHI